MKYAGFWIRFLAGIIDIIFLIVIPFSALFLLGLTFDDMSSKYSIAFDVTLQLLLFALTVAFWISSWQGTIGKRAVGIYIIDLSGVKLSLWLSVKRYLVMTVTMLPMIITGYYVPDESPKIQPDFINPEINELWYKQNYGDDYLSDDEQKKMDDYISKNADEGRKMKEMDKRFMDYLEEIFNFIIKSLIIVLLNFLFLILPIIVTKEKKAWHDMICGTRVVYGKL